VDTESAVCLLNASGLEKRFWTYAVQFSAYIRNRSLTKHNDEIVTPLELLTGVKPHFNLVKFGQPIYFNDQFKIRDKLSNRAEEGIFLGYPEFQMGVYVLVEEKIKVVRRWKVKEGVDQTTNMLEEDSEQEPDAVAPVFTTTVRQTQRVKKQLVPTLCKTTLLPQAKVSQSHPMNTRR
jgi:hypothetical protein